MKKSIQLLLIIVMLFFISSSSIFASEGDLTKVYTFKTDDSEFKYDAPKILREGGKEYGLIEITGYKVVDEKKYMSKTVTFNGLSRQNLPERKTFIIDGKAVQLELNQNNYYFTENKKTVQKSYNGYTSPPNIPETANITVSGKNFVGKRVAVDRHQTSRREPFTVSGKFIGEPGAEYTYKGAPLKLNGSTPTWDGYEQTLLRHLGLNSSYNIKSGRWLGGYQKENGQTVRYARFTGTRTRPIYNQTATYQYTQYNATALYDNGLPPGTESYTVKATAIYAEQVEPPEPEEDKGLPTWIKVGIGIAVLALLAVLILYIISKRRKQEEEE